MDEAGERAGPLGREWNRTSNAPANLKEVLVQRSSRHEGGSGVVGLQRAGMREQLGKQMQIKAARVAATKAVQPEPEVDAVPSGRVVVEEEDRVVDLPPAVLHKAWY